ncbi:EGF-like domain-containing protein 2 isoform X1 [Mercenaria mercenaria]|uniref:EGF-like domain-containing protein 2 isoform X1 n=2 Tax=Mercenaria mercenaria TaxID=6596 RepID=UPI00234EAC3C|nr:EGF-like domain-containing protein 2 isoform X1 [Mercenaria mercenaria]
MDFVKIMILKMRLHLLVAVIFISILTVKSQYKYDCRRIEDCKNGGKCTENDCTCVGTFGGHDCGYDTAQVDACTADPNPCQNGGVCYNDGTSDLCYCVYGFFGKTCENKTVVIDCEGNSVDFTLAFPMDFAGTVKLGDDPNCAMTEKEDKELGMKTYSVKVDISENGAGCNVTNIENATNPETGATEFSGLFEVNYLPFVTTGHDELYNLTCSHESADIQLSQAFPSVDVVKENLTVSEFNETYSPVELAVLDAQGNPMAADTQLFVGDVFQLHVYLTDELAFNDVLIERCTTNNTLKDADQKTFVVLDRGCPTKLSKRLTKGQEVKMYDTTLPDGTPVQTNGKILPIEAFKFVDSSLMGIVCSVKVCKPGDLKCQVPTNCDEIMYQKPPTPTEAGGATEKTAEVTAVKPPTETPTETPAETPTETPAVRRKRRAANKNAAEEESVVSTVLTVVGPSDYRSSRLTAPEHVNTLEKCLAHEEITAVVAVLGTAVCTLLIACFILSCLTIKRRAKESSFHTMPQPNTEKFRIPRAHINDSFTLGDI